MLIADPIAPSALADTTGTTAPHARLLHAAQQFEGVMLNELMKPLSQPSIIEDSDESGAGKMQSFGVEAMADALARSGALGFAKRIVATVEARESH